MTETSIPQSGLSWPIRRSFVDYVLEAQKGRAATSGGAVIAPSTVTWPLLDATEFEPDAIKGVLRFEGEVRFFAHFGALDVRLGYPILELDGEAGILSVRTGGKDSAPTQVARVNRITERQGPVGFRFWEGNHVDLLHGAVSLFGGVYDAGSPLESFIVALRTDPESRDPHHTIVG